MRPNYCERHGHPLPCGRCLAVRVRRFYLVYGIVCFAGGVMLFKAYGTAPIPQLTGAQIFGELVAGANLFLGLYFLDSWKG